MNGIKRRGFASMSPERIKQLATKGGKAAQTKGVAHRFSHEEAIAAGKKGKKKPHVI